jgi:exopolysaccharide/PEP-CTERM locus tyrosine autokinase
MSTIERAIDKLGRVGNNLPSELAADNQEKVAGELEGVTGTASRETSKPRDVELRIQEGSQSRIELDFNTLKAGGIMTPNEERSQIAEEFRHIKRPLLLNAFGEGAIQAANRNLIMVSSARPSEGKTFTTVNLALSIALERDRTVLLVDADVAKPSVSRILNFPGTAGLVDYLADHDRNLSELILQTSMPKLRILPAGRRHAHSTELLASETMSQLAQELAQRYSDRVVIFDSPPLLATSEAAVLAGLMGQLVMVVEAGKTKQEELREALALLDPKQYVGIVLNKSSKPFGADYYYGSYQAYGE